MANARRTAAYRRALRFATPTLAETAVEMGMHRNTVSGYMNRLPPSEAAVDKLVTWLRAHADTMLREADKLTGGHR